MLGPIRKVLTWLTDLRVGEKLQAVLDGGRNLGLWKKDWNPWKRK